MPLLREMNLLGRSCGVGWAGWANEEFQVCKPTQIQKTCPHF